MSLPVDKTIKVVLTITEYEGSLLVGLLRSQSREAAMARRFIAESATTKAWPDRLGAWEHLTEKVKSGIVEAKSE